MTITNHRQHGVDSADELSVSYQRPDRAGILPSLVGMLAGLGTLFLLSALLTAGAVAIDFELNIINDEGGLYEASILGLLIAAMALFASFVVGGYAAGRMAGYNGGVNGIGAGLWLVLLVAILAALGAWAGTAFEALDRFDLTSRLAQVDATDLTAAAVLASVVLVLATLLGGYVGGRLGETPIVDETIVATSRKAREDNSEAEDSSSD